MAEKTRFFRGRKKPPDTLGRGSVSDNGPGRNENVDKRTDLSEQFKNKGKTEVQDFREFLESCFGLKKIEKSKITLMLSRKSQIPFDADILYQFLKWVEVRGGPYEKEGLLFAFRVTLNLPDYSTSYRLKVLAFLNIKVTAESLALVAFKTEPSTNESLGMPLQLFRQVLKEIDGVLPKNTQAYLYLDWPSDTTMLDVQDSALFGSFTINSLVRSSPMDLKYEISPVYEFPTKTEVAVVLPPKEHFNMEHLFVQEDSEYLYLSEVVKQLPKSRLVCATIFDTKDLTTDVVLELVDTISHARYEQVDRAFIQSLPARAITQICWNLGFPDSIDLLLYVFFDAGIFSDGTFSEFLSWSLQFSTINQDVATMIVELRKQIDSGATVEIVYGLTPREISLMSSSNTILKNFGVAVEGATNEELCVLLPFSKGYVRDEFISGHDKNATRIALYNIANGANLVDVTPSMVINFKERVVGLKKTLTGFIIMDRIESGLYPVIITDSAISFVSKDYKYTREGMYFHVVGDVPISDAMIFVDLTFHGERYTFFNSTTCLWLSDEARSRLVIPNTITQEGLITAVETKYFSLFPRYWTRHPKRSGFFVWNSSSQNFNLRDSRRVFEFHGECMFGKLNMDIQPSKSTLSTLNAMVRQVDDVLALNFSVKRKTFDNVPIFTTANRMFTVVPASNVDSSVTFDGLYNTLWGAHNPNVPYFGIFVVPGTTYICTTPNNVIVEIVGKRIVAPQGFVEKKMRKSNVVLAKVCDALRPRAADKQVDIGFKMIDKTHVFPFSYITFAKCCETHFGVEAPKLGQVTRNLWGESIALGTVGTGSNTYSVGFMVDSEPADSHLDNIHALLNLFGLVRPLGIRMSDIRIESFGTGNFPTQHTSLHDIEKAIKTIRVSTAYKPPFKFDGLVSFSEGNFNYIQAHHSTCRVGVTCAVDVEDGEAIFDVKMRTLVFHVQNPSRVRVKSDFETVYNYYDFGFGIFCNFLDSRGTKKVVRSFAALIAFGFPPNAKQVVEPSELLKNSVAQPVCIKGRHVGTYSIECAQKDFELKNVMVKGKVAFRIVSNCVEKVIMRTDRMLPVPVYANTTYLTRGIRLATFSSALYVVEHEFEHEEPSFSVGITETIDGTGTLKEERVAIQVNMHDVKMVTDRNSILYLQDGKATVRGLYTEGYAPGFTRLIIQDGVTVERLRSALVTIGISGSIVENFMVGAGVGSVDYLPRTYPLSIVVPTNAFYDRLTQLRVRDGSVCGCCGSLGASRIAHVPFCKPCFAMFKGPLFVYTWFSYLVRQFRLDNGTEKMVMGHLVKAIKSSRPEELVAAVASLKVGDVVAQTSCTYCGREYASDIEAELCLYKHTTPIIQTVADYEEVAFCNLCNRYQYTKCACKGNGSFFVAPTDSDEEENDLVRGNVKPVVELKKAIPQPTAFLKTKEKKPEKRTPVIEELIMRDPEPVKRLSDINTVMKIDFRHYCAIVPSSKYSLLKKNLAECVRCGTYTGDHVYMNMCGSCSGISIKTSVMPRRSYEFRVSGGTSRTFKERFLSTAGLKLDGYKLLTHPLDENVVLPENVRRVMRKLYDDKDNFSKLTSDEFRVLSDWGVFGLSVFCQMGLRRSVATRQWSTPFFDKSAQFSVSMNLLLSCIEVSDLPYLTSRYRFHPTTVDWICTQKFLDTPHNPSYNQHRPEEPFSIPYRFEFESSHSHLVAEAQGPVSPISCLNGVITIISFSILASMIQFSFSILGTKAECVGRTREEWEREIAMVMENTIIVSFEDLPDFARENDEVFRSLTRTNHDYWSFCVAFSVYQKEHPDYRPKSAFWITRVATKESLIQFCREAAGAVCRYTV